MTNGFAIRIWFALVLLAHYQLGSSNSIKKNSKSNLVEPIFSHDSADAHTLKAYFQSIYEKKPISNELPTGNSTYKPKTTAGLYDCDDIQTTRQPTGRRDEQHISTAAPNVPGPTTASVVSRQQQPQQPTQQQSQQSSQLQIKRQTKGDSSELEKLAIESQGALSPAAYIRRSSTERPQHWSALTNYYKMMEQISQSRLNPGPSQIVIDDPLEEARWQLPVPGRNIEPIRVATKTQGPYSLVQVIQGSNRTNYPPYDKDPQQSSYPADSIPPLISEGSVISHDNSGKKKIAQVPERVFDTNIIITQSGHDDDILSHIKYLPDLIQIDQEKILENAKETLGDDFNPTDSAKQLKEDSFCRSKNLVKPRAVQNLAIDSNKPIEQTTEEVIAKQVAASRLGPGEYPSHMAIYNGTKPEDENYLCSASWIHESYALTVASCLKDFVNVPHKLVVRVGEWNMDKAKNTSYGRPNESLRPMVIRQVRKIVVFPKYANDQGDHNLALVEFVNPVNFHELQYVSPACKNLPQGAIRAKSCWSPVRNVTLGEYFDPYGEGETKLRRVVQMMELPINLITNNIDECKRKTGLEVFYLNYPHYICSGDSLGKPPKRIKPDHYGSGIYCNEGGLLTLVSMMQPGRVNGTVPFGYINLNYYKQWINKVVYGLNVL